MTCILDETIRKLAEATRENPHLARANFLTARDIADAALKVQTADLLDALELAESALRRPSLDDLEAVNLADEIRSLLIKAKG